MKGEDKRFAEHPMLPFALQCAVPGAIRRMRDWSFEERQRVAIECGQVIAEHGDDLLYPSKRKGGTAWAFTALTKGLAALAFQPGGVTFAGVHWCVGSSHSGTHDEAPCAAEIARENTTTSAPEGDEAA